METRRIDPGSTEYPTAMALLELAGGSWARPSPPLYVRGPMPPCRGVAIVGTRRASPKALEMTRELASELAREGHWIWSGGALGVDRAAHEGALAAGGMTAVVTAGGLDRPYPAEHSDLYLRVLEGGGSLISLQGDGSKRQRHHFIWRNAVLACLSQATILTEAPTRSGARSTAQAARRLRRPLLVVPHTPWSSTGAGCAAELSANAIALNGVEDALKKVRSLLDAPRLPFPLPPVVRYLHDATDGSAPPSAAAPAGEADQDATTGRLRPLDPPTQPRIQLRVSSPHLDNETRAVLRALGLAPHHVDVLCERTQLPFAKVSRALLTLTLGTLAVEGPPGHFAKAG